MTERSSAPRSIPNRTPVKVEIERLRRTLMTSSTNAARLVMAVPTLCAVLARLVSAKDA